MRNNTKQLVKTIRFCKSSNELEDLLVGLLTPQEIETLLTRIEIVKRLKKGESQRVIAESLGVGIATVTRGAKEVRQGFFKNIN